jgi:hypothetical protein
MASSWVHFRIAPVEFTDMHMGIQILVRRRFFSNTEAMATCAQKIPSGALLFESFYWVDRHHLETSPSVFGACVGMSVDPWACILVLPNPMIVHTRIRFRGKPSCGSVGPIFNNDMNALKSLLGVSINLSENVKFLRQYQLWDNQLDGPTNID